MVVVDFSATWCGPCQKIKPFFETLPSKYPNVVFISVDIDELQGEELVDDVSSVPTFKFFVQKKLVDKFSGANESKLLSTIDVHIQN